jgi:hypothetical protein
LSDNDQLIQNFADLQYTNHLGEGYMKTVERGDISHLYAIQCLIKDDFVEYERAMTIVRTKLLKKAAILKHHIMFYEGLAERNKAKMEQGITAFLQPKIHNKLSSALPLVGEFIAHPALGYAKLAWYKGIEVEIDSPFVPREWLPIQPLKDEEYVDYDFVKAYLG